MADTPISENTVHFEWLPESPGWLHRRLRKGEEILAEDVALVIENNPQLMGDEVVRELTVRGLRGQLKAARGRKRSPSRPMLVYRLVARYCDLVDELNASGKRVRRRSGPAPAAQGPSAMGEIHEQLAKEFRLGGGENVRNLISSFKNGRIPMSAPRRWR